MTAIGLHATSSFSATSMVVQNTGEQYTYTADNDLVAALSALRTGYYDQYINLPEINNGIPMEFRPEFRIFTTQPFTGLHPVGFTPYGDVLPPLFITTTGGQSADQKQGEAYMMVRLNISPKATSLDEAPGKRLLLTKAEFNVETQLGHSQANSQAYLTIYCGSRLINNQASSQILIPAGAPYTTVAPQAQIDDFDFANCREDLNVYYVVQAQNIQFKNMTWMISKVRDPETNPAPVSGNRVRKRPI